MRKNTFTALFCLIIGIGIFSSCISDEIECPKDAVNTDGYMKINFTLPDYKAPTTSGTRAMEPEDEVAIKPEQLSLLVFKADGNFYYKAPIVANSLQITPDKDVPSRATGSVTVKLVKSDTEKFDLVLIANHNISKIVMTEGETTKDEVLKALTYTLPADGKWNTGGVDVKPTPFPMWAEIKEVVVSENMNNPEVDLYRALARIDVGASFDFSNGTNTEKVLGLENFKIQSVRVYRTYNKGHVAPLADKKQEETGYPPAIPKDKETKRFADDAPLVYTIDEPATGVDRYVREIYVPEADLPGEPANNNMHTLVVGGFYGGSTTPTYYRLDFAQDEKDENKQETRTYLPILRNHRYLFNILNVKGPGFATPEEALESIPSGSIDSEVIVWDETIHEMHVHGKYYFGLDNREITLQAKSTTEDAENLKVIKYQTNYPITDADGISFKWEGDGATYFDAAWTQKGDKGEITITALTTNETNTVLTDVLNVKLGSFTIQVKVNQEYINFKYTLNCETVKVFGTYRPGHKLNTISTNPPTHRIELTITAEDKSILGSRYQIYTEPINGIEFKSEDTFQSPSLTEKVILIGEGSLETPTDARTEAFTVSIRSNSSSDSYCEATINPVIAKMKIVTMGDNSSYGYDVGYSKGGSNYVFTHPNNFGPNDNSRVKIEGFEFIRAGARELHHRDNAKAKALIEGSNGELADILYVAYHGKPSQEDGRLIQTYLRKGGVVVGFLQDEKETKALLNGIFSPDEIVFHSNKVSGGVLPFPGHNVYKEQYKTPSDQPEHTWDWYYETLLADPILNGPFGNICDKQWADDASFADLLTLPKMDGITVYTTGNMLNAPSAGEDKVSGFRYQTDEISLVFFTDGGVMSSTIRNNAPSTPGSSLCPFWWDPTDAFPTPKSGYIAGYEVYNSQLFMNIMAWAVNRSVELQPKRDASVSR